VRPLPTVVCLLAAAGAAPAWADVVTDGTVGPRVRLGGDFEIGAELGRRAGRNLFHSFERFSLDAGERATFTGPDQTRNVMSRVTGGERSDIDGTLRSTIPGADFYFFNPAGVVFGPNASLDLQGSFHVSTADELRFADGAAFSATDPAASSFTVAAPEAFGFLGAEPGAIRVDRSLLRVNEGETLSLVGGDITIDGGIEPIIGPDGIALLFPFLDAGGLSAPTGSLRILALGGQGSANPRTGAVTASGRADVTFTKQAFALVFGDGGGDVKIFADEVALNDFSQIASLNTGSTNAQGQIQIDARALNVRTSSLISTILTGAGNGTEVRIDADLVEVVGGIALQFNLDGTFGVVTPAIITDSQRGGSGDSGDITIRSSQVRILDTAFISSSSTADGAPGLVSIQTHGLLIRGGGANTLVLPDGFEIFAQPGVFTDADGAASSAGGTIRIRADAIRILNHGLVRSRTSGGGNAGTIDVEADSLVIRGGQRDELTGIASNAGSGSSGAAGKVAVVVHGPLTLTHGGSIGSATFSSGDAGSIRIVSDTLTIDGAGTSNFTGITTQGTFQQLGNAGSIEVTSGDVLIVDGNIRSSTFGIGRGGSITISAKNLRLEDGSEISAIALVNDAGTITLEIEDELRLSDSDVATLSLRSGGGITLTVGDLILLADGSQVISSILGDMPGDRAGDITIDPRFLILDRSSILARASAGQGGDIRITADQLLLSPGSEINAEAGEEGIDGTVVISAPEVDLAGGLVVLEGALLDAASQLRERCGARRDIGASSFTGVGRGGLPASPDAPLSGPYEAVPQMGRVAGGDGPTTIPASSDHPALVAAPCLGAP
jgi:filamentous hemagglutinin family protein